MKNLILTLTVTSLLVFTSSMHAQQSAPPDSQMKAVLDELASLGGKPITELSPEEARQQPSPADAVMQLILAQIDPLRSEGEKLAELLKQAGVKVNLKSYDGVAHEFFGMGAVVDKAKDAVSVVAADLKAAFGN